jgi:hypothetical protein
LFLTGWVLIERGHLARASRVSRDGASVNRELHDLAALRWCLAGIALAEAMSGHASAAAAAAAERDELVAGAMTAYETDLIERSRAWVCVSAGQLAEAREILAAAAARAAAARLRVAEARLLHDLARLGQPGSVAPRLAALAEMVDGEFVAALAGRAAALAGGAANGIEAAGRTLDVLGASLLAAEAYTAAPPSWPALAGTPGPRAGRRAGHRAADPPRAGGGPAWPRPVPPAATSPPGSSCRYGRWATTSRAPTPSSASPAATNSPGPWAPDPPGTRPPRAAAERQPG